MNRKTGGFPLDPVLLENAAGYEFKDKKLLHLSLCHSSYANESKDPSRSNERLEFLGDAVLSEIVSEYLYLRFPDRNEGDLSNMRRRTVERESLAGFSRKLSLGNYLYLGRGEEQNGGRELDSNLEDGFEALTAAIYLDGGRECVRNFVMPFVTGKADEFAKADQLSDPKSLLQEIVQETPGEILEYVITGEEGPDHDKIFYCEVRVNSNVLGKGEGKSKKEAEKSAAKSALGQYFDIPADEAK